MNTTQMSLKFLTNIEGMLNFFDALDIGAEAQAKNGTVSGEPTRLG
jgi:hypothetical protein